MSRLFLVQSDEVVETSVGCSTLIHRFKGGSQRDLWKTPGDVHCQSSTKIGNRLN